MPCLLVKSEDKERRCGFLRLSSLCRFPGGWLGRGVDLDAIAIAFD